MPGYGFMINRPQKVTVKALNELGKPVTLKIDGFLATVISHEIDHLHGILISDRDQNQRKDVQEVQEG